MAHKATPPTPGNTAPSWAAQDIPYRWLYVAMVVVLVTVVLFGALLWPTIMGLVSLSDEQNQSSEETPAAERPSGPLLQPSPEHDNHAYRALQQEILDSYGWQDKSAGIVRIPVERAKALILEEGVGPIAEVVTP